MATYYVDGATGSDSNNGTAESSAWATITHACATVSSGDTVYVKASQDYPETVTITRSMTLPTQFIGYGSTVGDKIKATVQGGNTRQYNLHTHTQGNHFWCFSNFIFEGATSRSMLAQNGFHRQWNFTNCIFRKGSGTATTAAAFGNYNSIDNSMITNCAFENFTQHGMGAKGTIFFLGCVFRNNGARGLSTDSYTSLYAHRCLFHDNGQHGFVARGGYITDSTFYNNGYRAAVSTNSNVGNIDLVNCVIVNHTNASYEALSGVAAFNCAFFNNHTKLSSSAASISDIDLTSDPFVDSASSDFTISSTSPLYSSIGHLQGADTRDMGAVQHADPSAAASSSSSTAGTQIYPFRNFVEDDFGGGGGGSTVIVIED